MYYGQETLGSIGLEKTYEFVQKKNLVIKCHNSILKCVIFYTYLEKCLKLVCKFFKTDYIGIHEYKDLYTY